MSVKRMVMPFGRLSHERTTSPRSIVAAAVLVAGLTVAARAAAQTPPPAPTSPPPETTAPPPAAPPPPAAETPPPPAPAPPAQAPAPPQPPAPPQYPYPPQYTYPPWPPPAYAYPPQYAYPQYAYPPPPAPTPPPAASQPPPAVVSSAPPPPPGSARVPASDPQADRVVLLPTAYTHPKGTLYISSYDVLFLQIGYALTDATQVTVTALPLPTENATFLDVSLKSALLASGPVRVAMIGSASGAIGKDIGVQLVGRAGGVAQACLDRACDSSLSLSTNLALAGPVVLMFNGAGAIVRVARRASFIGELATSVPLGTQGGQLSGAIVGGGVRLHFPHWGCDFTLIKPVESTTTAVPFFSVTYRS